MCWLHGTDCNAGENLPMHTHTPRHHHHQPFPASKRGQEPQHITSAASGAAALGIKGSVLHCEGSQHPEPRVPKVPSLVASPPW